MHMWTNSRSWYSHVNGGLLQWDMVMPLLDMILASYTMQTVGKLSSSYDSQNVLCCSCHLSEATIKRLRSRQTLTMMGQIKLQMWLLDSLQAQLSEPTYIQVQHSYM